MLKYFSSYRVNSKKYYDKKRGMKRLLAEFSNEHWPPEYWMVCFVDLK